MLGLPNVAGLGKTFPLSTGLVKSPKADSGDYVYYLVFHLTCYSGEEHPNTTQSMPLSLNDAYTVYRMRECYILSWFCHQ